MACNSGLPVPMRVGGEQRELKRPVRVLNHWDLLVFIFSRLWIRGKGVAYCCDIGGGETDGFRGEGELVYEPTLFEGVDFHVSVRKPIFS